jgi:hypothetical protein
MDSYIRLISCYLIEYAEDWETSKCYIRKEILQLSSPLIELEKKY